METINILKTIVVLFIAGVFIASIYSYYNEKKIKLNKRKCRLDKYNK